MAAKTRLIITATVIALITLTVYTLFRAGRMEKANLARLEKSYTELCDQVKLLESRGAKGVIRQDQVEDFIGSAGRTSPVLAIVALGDAEGKILASRRNDALVPAGPFFDELMTSLQKEKPGEDRILRIRYFSPAGSRGNIRMYLGSYKTPGHTLLVAYSYRPPRREMVSLALEVLLIIILFVLLSAIMYMVFRGKSVEKKIPAEHTDDEGSEPLSPLKGGDILASDRRDATTEALNRCVFELFRNLYTQAGPDSVSLYLKKDEKLSKAYELKEKSFLRIDSRGWDTFDLETDMGRELRGNTPVMVEGGIKLLMPLIHEDILLGIIILYRKNPFAAGDIGPLKSTLRKYLPALSGFLVVKKVLVDSETGLLSSAGFEVHYAELEEAFKTKGSPFALILLAPVQDMSLTDSQYTMIHRLISPAVREKLPEGTYLCLLGTRLAILLPEMVLPGAAEIAERITRGLSRFHIKLEMDRIVHIQAATGIAATDALQEGLTVRMQAEQNLARSIS